MIKFMGYGDKLVPILQLQKPFFKLADVMLLTKNRNKEISKREFQIDQMVYQLYGLTEEVIALVEKG